MRRRMTAVGVTIVAVASVVCVASAASAERVWLAPVKLPGAVGGAFYADVAVNGGGDAAVVWQRRRAEPDAASTYVQGVVRPFGGIWRAPVQLSEEGVSASFPQVGIGEAGAPVAVWHELDTASTSVRGGAFGAASGDSSIGLLASDPDIGHAFARAHIAVDAQGNALAVWDRDFIGGVQSSSRARDGHWQPAITLAAQGSASHVAANAQGDVIAAWQSFSGVQVTTRRAGGGWQSPITVSAAGENAVGPHVAIDRHANAVVAWNTIFDERSKVRAATMTAPGGWQPATEVTAGGAGARPRVAMDGDGNALAVWEAADGSGVVRSSVHLAGASEWQNPVNLSASGANARAPRIAVDSNGAAIAIWERDNNSITRVQAARRPAGGTWQAPVTLSGRSPASSARVAVDARGRALALWVTSGDLVTAEYTTGPAVSHLRISPTTLTPSRRARVSYALNTSARVRFTLERAEPGRRYGNPCVRQTSDNRYGYKRCTRWLPVPGSFTRTRRPGADQFAFAARRPTGAALQPGRYKLVATAVSGRQTGRPARSTFRIGRQ